MFQLQPEEGFTQMEQMIIQNVRNTKKRETLNISKDQQILRQKVIDGCLHFVQDQFGSAFCIQEEGLILTCAHCVVDENIQNQQYKTIMKKMPFFYLIFNQGEIVKAQVIQFDLKLDCALLQIIERDNYGQEKISKVNKFPYVNISKNQELPQKNESIFCIGQPGYEDLESNNNNKKTNYTPFFTSGGKVKGYLKNDQIQVCSETELGPLKHDCWTYWGHSGAPIFNNQGDVIGMHNSWNDKNAMRHGMSLLSLQNFIKTL